VPRPMTVRGRALLALLMGVLERTHYVKDVLANQRRWEDSAGGIFTRRPGVFVDEQQLAVRGTSASADRDARRC